MKLRRDTEAITQYRAALKRMGYERTDLMTEDEVVATAELVVGSFLKASKQFAHTMATMTQAVSSAVKKASPVLEAALKAELGRRL